MPKNQGETMSSMTEEKKDVVNFMLSHCTISPEMADEVFKAMEDN